MAEGAGGEDRDRHEGELAVRETRHERAERHLARVELLVDELPEEDLLWSERQEHQVEAVRAHPAVAERADAVVVADGEAQSQWRTAPPSTTSVWPVIASAAGEARK